MTSEERQTLDYFVAVEALEHSFALSQPIRDYHADRTRLLTELSVAFDNPATQAGLRARPTGGLATPWLDPASLGRRPKDAPFDVGTPNRSQIPIKFPNKG